MSIPHPHGIGGKSRPYRGALPLHQARLVPGDLVHRRNWLARPGVRPRPWRDRIPLARRRDEQPVQQLARQTPRIGLRSAVVLVVLALDPEGAEAIDQLRAHVVDLKARAAMAVRGKMKSRDQ